VEFGSVLAKDNRIMKAVHGRLRGPDVGLVRQG
jgi:hypothetical protein